MMWDMMWQMWWMWLFWFLVLVLIIAGIGLVIWAVTRGGSSARSQIKVHQGHDSALQILRERFARGEIDEAQYQERRRMLEIEDTETTQP